MAGTWTQSSLSETIDGSIVNHRKKKHNSIIRSLMMIAFLRFAFNRLEKDNRQETNFLLKDIAQREERNIHASHRHAQDQILYLSNDVWNIRQRVNWQQDGKTRRLAGKIEEICLSCYIVLRQQQQHPLIRLFVGLLVYRSVFVSIFHRIDHRDIQ